MSARATAAAVLVAVGLLAGCAREHGSAATTPSPSVSRSGQESPARTYSDMEKKVAAAESALAQADKDATADAGTDAGAGR